MGNYMKNTVHKIGKFYTRMILDNIGIFIFVGLLSVIFNDYGWFPNKDMYAISQLAYQTVLPIMVSYTGGKKIGGTEAGVLAALAVLGFLAADVGAGLWGAMILGPVSGFLWKFGYGQISKKVKAGLLMLFKNLCLGVMAGVLAALSFYIAAPFMEAFTEGFSKCIAFFVHYGLIGALSIVTEPAKVLFLNNLINHGIFIPIGMEQVQETGHSVLFLLEVNPGPGFGMLVALFLRYKDKRNEYGAAMFTQVIGGLHEVYFPYVLSNLWLLLPLIMGGSVGNIVFRLLGAGLQGAVSPGSVLIILLMAGKGMLLPVIAGIAASAFTAFLGSLLVLERTKGMSEKGKQTKVQDKSKHIKPSQDSSMEEGNTERESVQEGRLKDKHMEVKKIAVVCDGGVGTSAMGAALLRRKMSQEGVAGIEIKAWAADLVPADVDLIICQKDYMPHLPDELRGRGVYSVDNLLEADGYKKLVMEIQESIR